MKNSKDESNAWSAEQRDFTVKNYGPMTARQIAEKIGKSVHAVRKYVARYDQIRLSR